MTDPIGPPPNPPAEEADGTRSCWICFETEEENPNLEWVQPCKCRGSTKWVHQRCIKHWIEAKQRGNFRRSVLCPQCRTEYIIIYPAMSKIAVVLDVVDNVVNRLTPYFVASLLVGSLYVSAAIYGSVTLLQVVGPKKGFEILKSGDPIVILIGLPAIFAGLVLGRAIHWGNAVIQLMRGGYNVTTAVSHLFVRAPQPVEEVQQQQPAPILSYRNPPSRIVSGALLLPTIASMMGGILFESVGNKMHRVVLGGGIFIAVKGIMKAYLWKQRDTRERSRRVLDYPENMPANDVDQQFDVE